MADYKTDIEIAKARTELIDKADEREEARRNKIHTDAMMGPAG